MKIKVTEEHIRLGVASNCRICPIALAIREVIDKPIRVYPYMARIDGMLYNLPIEVSHFIRLFDMFLSRHLCQPFEFELPGI